MIEFQNVSVVYAREHSALSHISLHIEPGEFVWISGPTGAGKSTLLKLIYRAEVPTHGRVFVEGEDVADLPARDVPWLRRRMGVVAPEFGLLPGKTLFENVALPLRVVGAGPREVRRKVWAALGAMGLEDRRAAFPHEISGGQRQLVALARALVDAPPLLIADTPTGHLDPDTSARIMELLAHVHQRGTTVVVAAHGAPIPYAARPRLVRFEQGRLVSNPMESRDPRE